MDDEKDRPRAGPFWSAGVADTTRAAGDRPDPSTTPRPDPHPSTPTPARDAWGSLQLIDELGRGAFGRVYRAWDPTLAREVALKIVRLPEQDAALAASVLREGRMLARVRHTNVVAVYGAQQIDDEIGLWMELIRGRRLADIVRDDGPMSAEEASIIAVSLCHALSAVHGAGLLHRDVKAHNVMREAGGRIVLMDFGAGRDMFGATGSGDYAGTPLYMAPEVLAGRPASAASDIYSLGVLLYFLVTGRYPYEGHTAADVVIAQGLGRRRLLSDLRADLPDSFVRVVERALDASLQRRYASAGAMLEELAESTPVPSPAWRRAPVREAERDPDAWWRSKLAVAGLSLLGAIVAIGLLGFLTTIAFETTLGVQREFRQVSPGSWLYLGLQSLVAPAVYAIFFVLAYRAGSVLVRLLRRIVPRSSTLKPRSKLSLLADRLGLSEPANAAQIVLVLQIVILVLVWWSFGDFMTAAFTLFAQTADPSEFTPLRPSNAAPLYYRFVLTLAIVIMVAAWYRLLTAKSVTRPDRATTVGGMLVIALGVLSLQVPYKLVYQNDLPRTDYQDQRCYVLGERPDQVLLFCPDVPPPRNRVVPIGDPHLQWPARLPENIFLPRQEARR